MHMGEWKMYYKMNPSLHKLKRKEFMETFAVKKSLKKVRNYRRLIWSL